MLELLGVPGSPYTRKMLALLRYRRIPYALRWGNNGHAREGMPAPKVALLPTVYFPKADGEWDALVDSTPIIQRLEREYEGRSARPATPVQGFLCDLIEDYGDEWLTKVMFHYRWAHEKDRSNVEPLLVFWNDPTMAKDAAQNAAAAFGERQYGRLYVVGSNAVTGPIIEDSYRRLLELLDALLQRGEFLFGARPSAADFALFGQLTQLLQVEPTPAALAREVSPRLVAWADRMEDLSGAVAEDEGWLSDEEALESLAPLLAEIGRVYLPFLLANAATAAEGEDTVNAQIDGRLWTQPVFPYQIKCLGALLEAYRSLPVEAQERLAPVLTQAGCEALLGPQE